MPPKKKTAAPAKDAGPKKDIRSFFGAGSSSPRPAPVKEEVKRERPAVVDVDDDPAPPSKRTPPRTPPRSPPRAKAEKDAKPAASKGTPTRARRGSKDASADVKATKPDPKDKKGDDTSATPPAPKPRPKWGGPRDTTALNPGSKKIPRGPCDILSGLSFVISGRLESLDRDQAAELIKRHGGAVREAVSKLTSFLVKGEDCGAKKIQRAAELRTKVIEEAELLKMVEERTTKRGEDPYAYLNASSLPSGGGSPQGGVTAAGGGGGAAGGGGMLGDTRKDSAAAAVRQLTRGDGAAGGAAMATDGAAGSSGGAKGGGSPSFEPWTEKYAPRSLKDMVGGGGAPAKKLTEWLASFDANLQSIASTGKPLSAGFQRAVLLSGPPGCGKTTTSYLVGRAAGYDVREMNASEKRAAADVRTSANAVATSTSLLKYVGTLGATYEAGTGGGVARRAALEGASKGAPPADKLLLVMDEVDGSDIGGVAALIKVIQSSKNPIVCICNDRYNRKIRSLVKYCIDIRFAKQPTATVAKWLQAVTNREGLDVPLPALERLVTTGGGDVRHLLTLLESWAATRSRVSYDEAERLHALSTIDAEVRGASIFAIPESFLNGTRTATPPSFRSLQQQYYAGEFVDLFVQENYISMQPSAAPAPAATFQRMMVASEAIALGDTASAQMMREGRWSLSSAQFVLSAYYPASLVRGKFVPPAGAASWLETRLRYPAALGEQSRRSKALRVGAALSFEMNAATASAVPRPIGGLTARQLACEVVSTVGAEIVGPLLTDGKDGAATAAATCRALGLPKDEVQQLLEWAEMARERKRGLKVEPGAAGRGGVAMPLQPYSSVPPAVKSAFSRALGHMESSGRALKKGGGGVGAIGKAHEEGEVAGAAGEASEEEEGGEGDEASPTASKAKPKAGGKKAAGTAAGGRGRRPATDPGRGRKATADDASPPPKRRAAATTRKGKKRAAGSSSDDD